MFKIKLHWILIPISLGLAGCGDTANEETMQTEPASASPELSAIFSEEKPQTVIPVWELLQDPEIGKSVVVSGQIGGAVSPFVEGYAVFFFADEGLTFCDEMGDDHCPTPWDACCEDPEKVMANRILVRFTDESGEILPVGLEGVNGLQGLDKVIVSGTLESGEGGGYVVNADSIFTDTTDLEED